MAGRGGPGPSGRDLGAGGVEAVRLGGPGWSGRGGGCPRRLGWRRWARLPRREGGGVRHPGWSDGVEEGTFPRRPALGRSSETPPEAAPASWPWARRSPRAARILLTNPLRGDEPAAQSLSMPRLGRSTRSSRVPEPVVCAPWMTPSKGVGLPNHSPPAKSRTSGGRSARSDAVSGSRRSWSVTRKLQIERWCRRLRCTFTNPGTGTQPLTAHLPPSPTLTLGERDPSDGSPQPAAVNSLEMETLLT